MQGLKVKKWGGENAGEFEKSPQNIVNDFVNGNKQLVVVSAVRNPEFNTTDNLIQLSNLLDKGKQLAYDKLEEIRAFHINILREKIGENTGLEEKIINYFDVNLLKPINSWFDNDRESKVYPNKNNDYQIGFENDTISIIGFGENLSAFIQSELINNLGISGLESEVVNLQGVTDCLDEYETENEVFLELSSQIKDIVLSVIENSKVPIIPGYIPGFKDGIEKSIGRGYSDATASMVSIGLSNSYDITLEIQKSVEGMLSIDPRLLDKGEPKLISSIDYITAKEITGIRGSQAKLLHSQVLRKELLKTGIKIRLFDPFGDSKGTVISRYKNTDSKGVEYIGARDNVIFFSISSWDMSYSGILSSIFDIVGKYKISVDIVSTSETEISFTINNNIGDDILNNLSSEIREKLDILEEDEINFVKYKRNKALVFCVGQNLNHALGSLSRATSIFEEGKINAEIVSQGSMERSMIFGVNSSDMRNVVNLLHNEFIE